MTGNLLNTLLGGGEEEPMQTSTESVPSPKVEKVESVVDLD